MRSIRISAALLAAAILVILASSRPASACGYDGFFMSLGYEQLFMVTPEHQSGMGGGTDNITFGPGYGAHLDFGYDFCGSRWGLQMPIEYARLKLNRSEWVNSLGGSLEAILRLAEWKNGLDFHLVGGAGFTYLSEGSISNNSASAGITFSAGPGLTYIFSRSEKLTTGIAVELPFRYVYYFGNHLSNGGTSVFAFPLRLSIQLGF